MVSNGDMKVLVIALLVTSVCISAPCAPTLVACACGVEDTVCLSDLQMFEYATHIEMSPDLMGNHSNYHGVAVFQIGFDEKGRDGGGCNLRSPSGSFSPDGRCLQMEIQANNGERREEKRLRQTLD